MPTQNIEERIVEEFRKVFIEDNLWKSDNEDTANVAIERMEDFLKHSLSLQREETLKIIKKKKKREGYEDINKEFMLIGYNDALDDIIKELQSEKV